MMMALPAGAQAGDWQVVATSDDRRALLTYAAGEAVSYSFACTPTEVIVTQTGVTKLLDLRTGAPIGDDAKAIMPEGAALMALFSGKGEPQFLPAEAAKNPVTGWDLTIRLPLADKQIKAAAKSQMLSLFTTGYTMAVPMDAAARAKWSEFLQKCNIAK
ncbi:hypothetical protein [Sandarakinorhabdus cyanobacteriorum]|nr:hypothetical protein [Sandarakinorhabdus cyanobacteriorum]